MNNKILYDKSGAFYPESDAQYIHSNAINDNSTVFADLQTLHSQIASLTGADKIDGALSLDIYYGVSSTINKDNAIAQIGSNWSDTVQTPTIQFPYVWMKMQFHWTANGTVSNLTPAYCAIATKGVETQTMYTSLSSMEGVNGLAGPNDFSVQDTGLADTAVPGVTWTYYFPGIDPAHIYGLCATRIIEPGGSKPVGDWLIKLMAQYPTTQ